MNQEIAALFQPLTLRSGVTLNNRFVMSPMVANGSSTDGHVTDEDVAYFNRRSQSAALLITGATSVSAYSNAFGYGLANCDDTYLPGMTKLASAMKQYGAKAMMQLFHSGREAKYSYRDTGKAYAPSAIDFPFLDYPLTELSDAEIKGIIADFAAATKRAIAAGFDGVEIHGANHYLIQQFFSAYSNRRNDHWGGSLAKRMAFPLAVVDAVMETVARYADRPFIVGYRISPEEIHGENVGYTFDEALELIKAVAKRPVDYIHLSTWGQRAYQSHPTQGQYQDQTMAQTVKAAISDAIQVMIVGDMTSAEKVAEASHYGDLFALASSLIVAPDFVTKLKNDQGDTISLDVTGRVDDLHLPSHFAPMTIAMRGNQSIPEATFDALAPKK